MVCKKSKKKKSYKSGDTYLIIIAILLIIIGTQQCVPEEPDTVEETTQDTSSGGSGGGSGIDPENCWWQEIDSYSGTFEVGTRTEWKNTLVPGAFMWGFESDNNLAVTLVREMTSYQHYAATTGFEYEFDVTTSEEHGVAVSNGARSNIDGVITLYQWICEGDVLN